MGKEEDDADPAFGFSELLARPKLQDHGGWMGTPLRALIARESAGSFRDAPIPISPARKTLADEFAGRRRRSGACRVPGSVPSSGCSSPRTRADYASHKIAVAEFWRPEQLGALLAQEREDPTRDVAEEPEPGSSFRSPSPSPGNRSSKRNGECKVTKVATPDVVEPSPELRYLFAKDWALQTSDDDDEFWDSGILCGIASPSPRPARRRTRRLTSKLRHSSSSHSTPLPPTTQPAQHAQRSQIPPLSATPTIVASPACALSSKPSLATLLAEEVAASSSVATEPVPARRPKIASVSDIATPVRPESLSQLDFLIAKIVTLRTASAAALAGARCSTSGSTAAAEPSIVKAEEQEQQQECAAHSPVILPTTVTAATNRATSKLTEPPDSPSPSTHEEPFTPSDAALRNDGDEPEPGLEAPAPERVQLGILLERTREEHGWRSRMSSPLVLLAASSCSEVCLSRNPELVQHEEITAATAEIAPELVMEEAEAVVMAAREERPSTQRVSLLSLLNQDMQMDLQDGVQLEMLCGGCRSNEEEEEEEEGGEQAETKEELDPMCCVCMVGVKGAAFIPCGHTFCRKCCREVRRSLGSCPLCNQAIVDVLKLY